MGDHLSIGGPGVAKSLELGTADLAALASEHQVPDVGAVASGRLGRAVWLRGLLDLAGVAPDARFVHVESSDGGFTANVKLEQALAGALVLYELEGEPLPAKFGGPFRLLFVDEEDCSVNVKFLAEVQLVAEPGSHTARCAD